MHRVFIKALHTAAAIAIVMTTSCPATAQISDSAQRFIPMDGTLNTRDIGGYKTADGREVVWARMYRSANLTQISASDQKKLEARRVGVVVDFRGPKEAQLDPDRLPSHARYINSPIIGDASGDALSREKIEALLTQADLPPGMFDAEKVNAIGPYYRMLALVNNYGTEDHLRRIKGYKPLFQTLLGMKDDEAVLFHCTGGRDRTGVGAALVLRALGVPDATIKEDFVASNYYLQPDRDNPDSTAYQSFKSANLFIQPPQNKNYQEFASGIGTTPEKIRNAVVLRGEMLDKLFDAIDVQYGSFDVFLRTEMGVGPNELALLRQKFTRKSQS
ncbi:tyrosine-protein phosphatase [Pseudomonas aeruginosa]|uniref:tyrosine-protein phosphatase n=1 Tax=Pluralibacter gergoviae TaxID=61647 RepID=UPI0018418CAA|nr:tyrosine-protein phosphatase [Pseudomonas aeruginosa]HBP6240154.1 tyrosine-protein phosphatase [Pseudomonas aeruginosa]